MSAMDMVFGFETSCLSIVEKDSPGLETPGCACGHALCGASTLQENLIMMSLVHRMVIIRDTTSTSQKVYAYAVCSKK